MCVCVSFCSIRRDSRYAAADARSYTAEVALLELSQQRPLEEEGAPPPDYDDHVQFNGGKVTGVSHIPTITWDNKVGDPPQSHRW